MKKYNMLYLKKNLKLSLGLYLVLNGAVCLDSILKSEPVLTVIAKITYFMPLLVMCLIFMLMAYKGFEKSVKKEEKKHNVVFSDNGEILIDKKHLIYHTDEWLIFSGRNAIHFGSIAEISDPFKSADMKVGGEKYSAVVTTDKGKYITVKASDPTDLSSLKTAYYKYKENP